MHTRSSFSLYLFMALHGHPSVAHDMQTHFTEMCPMELDDLLQNVRNYGLQYFHEIIKLL